MHRLEGVRESVEATLDALGCRLHARPENIGRVANAVEVRLYKKALNDRNEITTWNDLTAKLKAALLEALEKTRNAEPTADGTQSLQAINQIDERPHTVGSEIAIRIRARDCVILPS